MLRRILTICGGLVLCVMAAVVTMGADPGTYGTAMKSAALGASAGDTLRLSGSHRVMVSWDIAPTLIFAGSRMGTGDTDPSAYGRDTLTAAHLVKLGNSFYSGMFYDLDTLMIVAGTAGCTYAAVISRNITGEGALAARDKALVDSFAVLIDNVAGPDSTLLVADTLAASESVTVACPNFNDLSALVISGAGHVRLITSGAVTGITGGSITLPVGGNALTSISNSFTDLDSIRWVAGAAGLSFEGLVQKR